jgi:hypothetical protein
VSVPNEVSLRGKLVWLPFAWGLPFVVVDNLKVDGGRVLPAEDGTVDESGEPSAKVDA